MDTKSLKPEDRAKLSSTGLKCFSLIEFDDQEGLLCEIRKHPIGLFFIYLTGCFITLAVSLVLGFVGFSGVFEGSAVSSSNLQSVIVLVGFVFVIFIIIAMIIQAMMYSNNVIFVTTEKIAQVLYINLFNRKISQLSIGDVQDVTVTQKGVLAHMFNYGTLVIETAGEQQNYTFTFIPEPYKYSKIIVGAHERNLVKYGN